jgi:putative ABC transport system permease protein
VNLSENIIIGLNGLLSHKLRSVLTALGIIFGVAAVIAMLSIGEGARQEALEQISLMGVNNIIIRSKEPTAQSFGKAKANFSPGLELQDSRAIRDICSFVQAVVPQWEKSGAAQYKSERKDVKVIGTTPDFINAFNYTLADGRFLQQAHLEGQENVCVLGSDAKDQIFHFENPLGKQIKLDNQWFTVVGVMQRQIDPKKKLENLKVRNLNMDVYIPITTAQFKMTRFRGGSSGGMQFFGGGFMVTSSGNQNPVPRNLLDQMTVKVKETIPIDEATAVIQNILKRRHYGIDDFEVIVPEALVQQSQQTQQIFNIVMGAIAGISLLVGGIGIMNIMLASVMERTKEIGVRRAVGATRADVLGQFLFEAIFLSVVGGLVGIALGFSLTKVITLYAEWRTVVSFPTVLLAFGVSAAVGIAFGYYPARKAAFQNPIESLRYE